MMSHPAKCLVWMAPKYQHNHDYKGGTTELINMRHEWFRQNQSPN